MKSTPPTVGLFLILAATQLSTGCAPRPGSKTGPAVENAGTELPALVVDANAPLLLAEPASQAVSGGADNSPCLVCHANFESEKLAVTHAEAEIGCVGCHGDSHPHRNDENHLTPPDKMFPVGRIIDFCKKCHRLHDLSAAKVAQVRKRWPEKSALDPVVCTDCHGSHRLKRRSVRWNKETGELAPGN